MTTSTFQGYDVYRITCRQSGGRADIVPKLGGVVASWQVTESGVMKELLFRHEWFWDRAATRTRGGIPFMFPICGRLERGGEEGVYRWQHVLYRMPIHGFAMRVTWEVIDAREDEVTLELRDNDATRTMYPFLFRVQLRWRVSGDELVSEQEFENAGSAAMPYAAGFHPYFLTPEVGAGKERVMVSYRARRKLLYNQRLTEIVGECMAPPAPISIEAPEINETLLEVEEGSVGRLDYPDGSALEVSAGGMGVQGMWPYLQMYTMPEKPFFCVEPWMSFANALNLAYGMRWLGPGERERAWFKCRYVRAA